ncbi:MAG: hypothetical protein WBA45_07335 [Microthrixaceae bacterium]
MYPDAGEAVTSFSASYQSVEDGGVGAYDDLEGNLLRAERRARTKVRRYCTANAIDRLVTLTFAEPFCTDPRELTEHRKKFVRRLRCALKHKFPYVWVPELHKDGIKLHAHMGINRFVKKEQMAEVWGNGFVDLRLIRVRNSKNELEHRRRAASYLSKYIGKAFDHPKTFGCHRYEVGQGFQPRVEKQTFQSEEEARAWASTVMGGTTPSYVWHHTDVDDWKGPPVSVAYWDEVA